MNNMKVIVFDVDGTLADVMHRVHFVRNKPRNWPAFNRAMKDDTPNHDIVWLFKTLWKQEDTIMLVASGRGEETRGITESWLLDNEILCEKLYMRPAADYRSDDIIKAEILEQIRAEYGEPFMVFDDRNQVTDMWREKGVRCLQVAPGDF
jgi:FMN phosphatase YigB (HAD superfamily)